MTTPSTVTTSPHFEEIVQFLKAGMPYRRAAHLGAGLDRRARPELVEGGGFQAHPGAGLAAEPSSREFIRQAV